MLKLNLIKSITVLAICLAPFAHLAAQTFSSGHLHVTISNVKSHDSTSCASSCAMSYNITVDSSYTGETLFVVDTLGGLLIGGPYVNSAGTSPWTFTASLYSSGTADWEISSTSYAHFTGPGTKVTCGRDTIRGITDYDSLLVTDPCIYSNVTGRIYADNNDNCTFDAGDTGLYVVYAGASANQQAASYYPDGTYSLIMQTSWIAPYTVSLPSYYAFIFPFSSCFTGSYSYTTSPQSGVDFPVHCTSSVDVECYPLSPAHVRLHRSFFMQPFVNNSGCDTVSGQLTLVKDSRVTYDASATSVPADIVHGDTLIWNYANMCSLAGGAYWNSFFSNVSLTPDGTVAVGDSLCFRVYTNIPAADIDPTNNDYSVCMPVVYSYDPNEKEVSPKGTGPDGDILPSQDTLTYNIHFQNTGTASADNIKIIDTLDSHITAKSLKIIGTSHNMTPQWLTPNVVEFDYNNINLPDSGANEAASHGEVRFSVVLNTGLPLGTQIRNKGYIYFDLNPPVITNTTLNTIATSTYLPQVARAAVKVYPNPATDHIVVENLANGTISIMNISGSTVLEQSINNDKTTIDVSSIAPGVYILKTTCEGNTTITKFTKY